MAILSKALVVISLLVSAPAFSQIDFRSSTLSDFDSVDSLSLDGAISVIVEYETPGVTVSALNELEDKDILASVASARSLFVSSLSPATQNRMSDSFQYYPGVVMQMNSDALAEIQSNPLVKDVYINKLNKPFLAQSRSIVHAGSGTSEVLGEGWTVAVLDTGSDKNHDFLRSSGAAKVVSEACYSGFGISDPRIQRLCPGNAAASTVTNSGLNCTGFDGCDHGTHVAGIAVGEGLAFGGVASRANLIAMQVFTGLVNLTGDDLSLCGGATRCILSSDSDIINGMERVFALRNTHNIAAVNFSLGGGRFASSCAGENTAFTATVARLKAAGIAVIAATGNEGLSGSLASPACIPDVIAVGATSDFTGTRFGFSFELDVPTFYSNTHPLLDLYAPGSAIQSSVPGNGFEEFDGTSQATPHVAGAFAVLKQANPDATVDQLEALLKSVGPDVVSPAGTVRKRLDLGRALKEMGFGSVNIVPILDILLAD